MFSVPPHTSLNPGGPLPGKPYLGWTQGYTNTSFRLLLHPSCCVWATQLDSSPRILTSLAAVSSPCFARTATPFEQGEMALPLMALSQRPPSLSCPSELPPVPQKSTPSPSFSYPFFRCLFRSQTSSPHS